MRRPPPFWRFFAVSAIVATSASADSLNSVASHLARGAAKLSSRKVAVLPFSYLDGGLSSGSSLVAEQLTTLLVGRKGVQVVERSQLDKVLSEARLELSGVTESSGTQKLGRILGVDAIVTGTLTDISDEVTEVNARLIQADNGAVLAAAAARIERTWMDDPRQPMPPVTEQETSKVSMSPLIPVSQGRASPTRIYVLPPSSRPPPPPPPRRRLY